MNKYVVNMKNLNVYEVMRKGNIENTVVVLNSSKEEVQICVDNKNYRYLKLIY